MCPMMVLPVYSLSVGVKVVQNVRSCARGVCKRYRMEEECVCGCTVKIFADTYGDVIIIYMRIVL